MNNKPILFEDKMKYRDNEFLYDKCIKQHDCIMRYQWKMCEYKDKLKEKDKEIERLKNKCDNETFSESYYYGHHKDLKQRIDKAIELLEKENYHCPMSLTVEKAYIIEVEKINNVISILKGENKPQYLGYSDKECINCGRLRVEKYSDGTEICEKCNFDQNKKKNTFKR